MAQKLFEIYHSKQEIHEINDGGIKKYIISGIFTKADSPNRNNNIYPRQHLQEAINKFREKVKAGKIKMRLDHPDIYSYSSQNLEKTAAILLDVSDINEEGYAFYKAQIIDEGCGKILRSILNAGGTVGVSTRGEGTSLPEQEWPGLPGKYNIIQAGFKLNSIDFVDEPSVSESEDTMKLEQRRNYMTIEDLKKQYPDLFKDYDKVFEMNINNLAKSLEEIKTKMTKMQENNTKLVTLIKENYPDMFVVMPESEIIKKYETKISEMNEKLVEAEKKNKELEDKITLLENEKVKIEKEKKIAELKSLSENAEYFKYDFVNKKFDVCLTADEVVKVFETLKNEIIAIKESEKKKFMPSKPKTENKETCDSILTEQERMDLMIKNEQRMAIGGLAPLTEKQYLELYGKK